MYRTHMATQLDIAPTHYDMTDTDGRHAYAKALVAETGSRFARVWVGETGGLVRIYTGEKADYIAINDTGDLDPEFYGGYALRERRFAVWDAADNALMECSTFTTTG